MVNVLLKEFVDVKDFRNLMKKHKIKVLTEAQGKEGFVFILKAKEEKVELIMIETHMNWEFR